MLPLIDQSIMEYINFICTYNYILCPDTTFPIVVFRDYFRTRGVLCATSRLIDVCRYVRPNHVQTDGDFTRLYPRNKARLTNIPLPPKWPPPSLIDFRVDTQQPEPEPAPAPAVGDSSRAPAASEASTQRSTIIHTAAAVAPSSCDARTRPGTNQRAVASSKRRLSGKAAQKETAAAEKARRQRRKAAPKLLVLSGLPGCGKSSFARVRCLCPLRPLL